MVTGKVFLVGAGPGDPELLTLKALKALRSADIVLHDDLVSAEILALIPPQASAINVGKRCGRSSTPQEEINRKLVEYGLLGLQVVRLKGGDPFLFGRGGEELEALRQAGIETEVVPGITAALGAAARTQIPLTHRELSSTLVLLTGSSKNSDVANWPEALPANATLVVYMPGHDFSRLRDRLIASRVAGTTPCAIISGATTANEEIHITTVNQLAQAPRLVPPRLLVVGEVVRFAELRRIQEPFNLALPTEYFDVTTTIGETE